MGAKIGGIFLLIIGLGVALYFYNSGGASKLGTALTPPGGVATSTATSTVSSMSAVSQPSSSLDSFFSFLSRIFNPPPMVIGPTVSPGGGSSGGGWGYSGSPGFSSGGAGSGSTGSGNTSSISPSDIPPGFTAAQLSPYFHEVRLGGVSQSQISLYAYTNFYNQSAGQIDITNWQIRTNHGGEYVPQAVNIYNPSGEAVLSDIIFNSAQNNVVYIYSTASAPVNLRLNECMGYLSGTNQIVTNQFNPPLPYSCPSIDRSAISRFTGACQNYILSLGCRTGDISDPQVSRSDYSCQQFIQNNLNYKSCIANHASDQNFLSNEWHIWTGPNSSPIDPYHDNVELLDRSGLLVDIYSY